MSSSVSEISLHRVVAVPQPALILPPVRQCAGPLHISIIASSILAREISIVMVLPKQLAQEPDV
jgi:hypothetical protein